MMVGTRRWLWMSALAWAAFAHAGPAMSQDYPNRPIRIVVPFAAGGSTDAVIRIVAQQVAETIGGSIVIDNARAAPPPSA
jgi:tripartite-type tricarboxylate transporter receptor subunit TctC